MIDFPIVNNKIKTSQNDAKENMIKRQIFLDFKTQHKQDFEHTNGLKCILMIKETKVEGYFYQICNQNIFCVLDCNNMIFETQLNLNKLTFYVKVINMMDMYYEYSPQSIKYELK